MIARLLRLVALSWMLVAPAAWAAEPALNLDRSGLALRGYDPVAYFTTGRATVGLPAFAAVHAGARYRFATAAHRDAFLADPEKYLPQYGGYCAYAVAHATKADADPTVWRIHGGRLFLNYDRAIGETWSRDADGYIAKGDEAWPAIRDKAAADLK